MKLKSNYWLLIGGISFVSVALYSVIAQWPFAEGFFNQITASIDWIAAVIIYFFLGAFIGHLIDWLQNRKTKHPLWFYLTAALWLISAVTIISIGTRPFLQGLLFPFIYGIFFTGFAFTELFPKAIYTSLYGKIIYDLALLGIFGFWLYYTIKNKRKLLTKILVIILFIVFFLGFIGCATALK